MIVGRHSSVHRARRSRAIATALALGLSVFAAGCHRSLPPNVTPPGETAAFSEPSPAASAAPQMETRK